MAEKIKNFILYIFTIIISLFILITFFLIIKYKPIIKDFAVSMFNLNWYVYMALIPIFSAAVIFIYHRFFTNLIEKCNRFLLIGIALVFTAIPRIVWINMVDVYPKSDFKLYYTIANALSEGRFYGKMYVAIFPHTFGYPFLLSLFFRLFSSKVVVGQILNICLCCGIAVLLYSLGRLLKNKGTGFLAAMIWAFWPSQIFYTVLLSTEALFTFLMLSSILLFYTIVKTYRKFLETIILFMLYGVLLVVVNAVRPFGIILILASVIYLFIFANNSGPYTGIKKLALSKIVPCMVLIFSYLLMFNLVSSYISTYTETDVAKSPLGFNTYVGMNIKYKGIWNSEDSSTLTGLISSKKYGAQEIQDILFQKAINRFIGNSYDNIVLLREKHKTMWSTDNDNIKYISGAMNRDKSSFDYLKYKRMINKVSNLYYYIILFICGMYIIPSLFIKSKEFSYVFILIIISGIIATHMIVEVAGRYHYPAMSLLALFSALSIYYTGSFTAGFKLNSKTSTNIPGVE